jgi:hypothetical protein
LDELPATLDETYERTLNEINDTNELGIRPTTHLSVVSRLLGVDELAEFLAMFLFKITHFGTNPTGSLEEWSISLAYQVVQYPYTTVVPPFITSLRSTAHHLISAPAKGCP